jgi:hypothetical protein
MLQASVKLSVSLASGTASNFTVALACLLRSAIASAGNVGVDTVTITDLTDVWGVHALPANSSYNTANCSTVSNGARLLHSVALGRGVSVRRSLTLVCVQCL